MLLRLVRRLYDIEQVIDSRMSSLFIWPTRRIQDAFQQSTWVTLASSCITNPEHGNNGRATSDKGLALIDIWQNSIKLMIRCTANECKMRWPVTGQWLG